MTKIIMTNSFRGGTGKSTIISNLAYYLSSFGYKVILVDDDVISPGVHTFFGLDNKKFDKTLTDFYLGDTEISDAVYDISDSVSLPDETLFIIPSTVSSKNIVQLLQETKNYLKIGKAIERVKKTFEPDFIMVDTHPGVNESFLIATNFTDILLNIIRPDNQDYQGAEVASTISGKVGLKTYFILNKVHEKLRTPELKKKVENAFKLPVGGMVPLTDEIILAQSQFVFSDRYPDHPFSKEIQNIAATVFGVKPKEHLELMQYVLNDIQKKKKVDISQEIHIKNVRSERIKRYITDMIEGGLLAEKRGIVTVSTKGEKYLKKYKSIKKVVDRFRF